MRAFVCVFVCVRSVYVDHGEKVVVAGKQWNVSGLGSETAVLLVSMATLTRFPAAARKADQRLRQNDRDKNYAILCTALCSCDTPKVTIHQLYVLVSVVIVQ